MEESKLLLTEPERPKKRKYGEPGSIMRSSDGKLYKVHEDGSWRRYHGAPDAPVDLNAKKGK